MPLRIEFAGGSYVDFRFGKTSARSELDRVGLKGEDDEKLYDADWLDHVGLHHVRLEAPRGFLLLRLTRNFNDE